MSGELSACGSAPAASNVAAAGRVGHEERGVGARDSGAQQPTWPCSAQLTLDRLDVVLALLEAWPQVTGLPEE